MTEPDLSLTREVVESCLGLMQRQTHPASAVIRDYMQDLLKRHPDLALELPKSDGGDETTLYRSSELTVLRIEGAPRTAYPPHDHRMTAIIAVLEGEEINTLYKKSDDGLEIANIEYFTAGETCVMGPSAIHSVANRRTDLSIGLHVYLGDLIGTERSLWDPSSNEEYRYTDAHYFRLAREVTSQTQ